MDIQAFAGPVDYKFVAAGGAALPDGQFTGYLAVFNNVDSHGDVILPGAFTDTLAARKAAGRKLPMHAMHGVFGGDGLPIGVLEAEEDDKGLRVHGKISGMTTEAGRLHWARLQDGAYGGLSIGYRPVESVKGKVAGEPKRTLVKIDLYEGSLVDDPSNALAKIDERKRARGLDVKTTLVTPNIDSAATAIAAAMGLHDLCLAGDELPTADERAAFLAHLQDAYEHLTQRRAPIVPAGDDDGAARKLAESFAFLSDFAIAR